jgi:penicillin amidase
VAFERGRIVIPRIVAALLALLAVAGGWAYWQLAASLPALEGRLILSGLTDPVRIERDAIGIPVVRGTGRIDVARALGFVQGQERYFQMDLQRRRAAGELAELVGPAALPLDRTTRVHRFRARAREILAGLSADERSLVRAYADGINAGLAALDASPFEYLLLGREPAPWRPEDSILLVHTMYLVLQGRQAVAERQRGVLRDSVPAPLYRFLTPRGDGWDAPLLGRPLPVPPIPGPEVLDLRNRAALPQHRAPRRAVERFVAGSNNWAVSGAHSAGEGALVANDMHLPWSVPNIWYRASLVWRESGEERRAGGVTMPGGGMVIVGSNGHVAWGFTNSQADWTDLVILEPVAGDPGAYLTPDGPRRFERHRETLRAAGGTEETLEVLETVWGPVTAVDHRGRRLATRWVAHDRQAVNLGLRGLESARSIEEALDVARRSGIPTQNFIVGDRAGNVGWTLIGPVPRRYGHDGALPSSWADGTRGWDGWLTPAEVPRIVNPESGRLWTANQRTLSGEALARVGFGGYASGARAGQIRDALLAVEDATEHDMLEVQLDDRALFLSRWRDLLLELLDAPAVAADSRRGALRRVLDGWEGRALPDSAAYRAVRAFRSAALAELFEPIVAEAVAADARFDYLETGRQQEGPLWRLVSERPPHLLDPRFESWRARLLALVDGVLDELGAPLERRTWGEANRLSMRHPLSRFATPLAGLLDMPAAPLRGDIHMPNAQTTAHGSSERMVVSPGREQDGILHTPGGQSGHPLSPYYDAGHEDWLHGRPTPFLPGPARHVLELLPAT